jgi:hypothetical protein
MWRTRTPCEDRINKLLRRKIVMVVHVVPDQIRGSEYYATLCKNSYLRAAQLYSISVLRDSEQLFRLAMLVREQAIVITSRLRVEAPRSAYIREFVSELLGDSADREFVIRS